MIDQKDIIPQQCLIILLERGYFQQALQLYEGYFLVQQIDLNDPIRNQLQQLQRQSKQFSTTIEISNMQIQKIRPVVEWAQNKQSIFLSMKKALRKDAPGCMDCNKDETIQIENQKIFASSYGVITHQPVQWILDLELEQEIIPEQSTWLEQGQGTFFFNLTKAQNGTLWENLEKNTTKQHGIWWDMQQKFKKDFDEWNKRRDGTYVPEQENNEENQELQNSDGENTIFNQETINFKKDGELSQNNNLNENHSQIKNSDNDMQNENKKQLDQDQKQYQQNKQEDL